MLHLAAAPAASGTASGYSSWMTILPFILMFAVFYFLLIRPQQRRQKNRNSMLSKLKKGDKVVTIGGLHGTIQEIGDDTVVLKVNDSTRLTFERSAINAIAEAAPESKS